MITFILIGAGQRGSDVYSDYIARFPEKAKLVAVAEPNKIRRELVGKRHGLREDQMTDDWKKLLSQEKMADAAIISTNDFLHYEPVKCALEKGYHLIVEKPMSNKEAEISAMEELALNYPDQIFAVAHVLRYTPFFRTIKELLDSHAIGDLISIQHNENIGYYHMAHSFVRGNWRNSDETSPLILAKSCHDMDILLYMAGSHCKKLASFGSLKHFRKEEAPEGAAKRCLDCPHQKTCAYSAVRFYLKDIANWPASTITDDHTEAGVLKALRDTDYGRCVYYSDNNVVDHQVTILEFENGVEATFHLSAFTHNISRTVKLMGSLGEIRGDMDLNRLEVYHFDTEETEILDTTPKIVDHVGHGGGDDGFIEEFIDDVVCSLEGRPNAGNKTSALLSAESHKMAFAAERARLENRVIEL